MAIHSNLINRKIQSRKGSYSQNSPYWIELKDKPQKWWYFILISLCFLFPKVQLAINDDRITINFLNKKTEKKNLETSFLLNPNKNHTNQMQKTKDFIDVYSYSDSNNFESKPSKPDLMAFPNLPSWNEVQNYQANFKEISESQNLSELPIFQKIVVDVDEIMEIIEPVNLSLQNKNKDSNTYYSVGFYSPYSLTINPFQKENLLDEALISFKRNLIYGYTINKNQIKERISLDNIDLRLVNANELLFKWDNQIYRNNSNEDIHLIIKKIIDQLQTCQQLLNSRINIQNATQKELIGKTLDYSVTELHPLNGEELNFEQWNSICQFLHFLTTTISFKNRSLEYIENPDFHDFMKQERLLEEQRKKALEEKRKQKEREAEARRKAGIEEEENDDEENDEEEELIEVEELSEEGAEFNEFFEKSVKKLVEDESQDEIKPKDIINKDILNKDIIKLRKVDYEKTLSPLNKPQQKRHRKLLLTSILTSLPPAAIKTAKTFSRPFRMLTHPLDLPLIDSYLRTLYPFAIQKAYLTIKNDQPEYGGEDIDEDTDWSTYGSIDGSTNESTSGSTDGSIEEYIGPAIINEPSRPIANFLEKFKIEVKPAYIENKYLRAVGGFFYRNTKRIIVNSPRLTYLGYIKGRSLSNHLTYFTQSGRTEKYHKIPLENRVKTYRQLEKFQTIDSPYSLLNEELGNLMYVNSSIVQEAIKLDPYGIHELIQQFALELELKRLAKEKSELEDNDTEEEKLKDNDTEENSCENSLIVDEEDHNRNLLDIYRKVIDKILSLLIQGVLPTVDLDQTTNAKYGSYLSPDSVTNFNLILMNIINTNLKLFKNINEYYSYDNGSQATKTKISNNNESKHNILYESQILHNPVDINTRFEKIEKNIYDTQTLLNEAISVLDQKKHKNSINYDEVLTNELNYKSTSLKKKFKTGLFPKFIYKQEDISVNNQLSQGLNREIVFKTNEDDFINQFGDFTHETRKYFEIVKYLINQNDDIDVSSFHKLIQFIDNTDNHLNDQTIPYIWNFFADERDKQLNLAFGRIKNTQEFVEKVYESMTHKADFIEKEILALFEDDETNEFDLNMLDEFESELDDIDEKDEELAFNLIETEKAIEQGDTSWSDTYEDELVSISETLDLDEQKLVEKGPKLPKEMKLNILDETHRAIVKGNTDSRLYPLLKKYILLGKLLQKVQIRFVNLLPDTKSFHTSSEGMKIHKTAQRRFDEYILSKLTKFYTLEKYIQYLKQYNQSQKTWGFHESHEHFRGMQLRNEFYNILDTQAINLVGPINFRLNLKENKGRDFSPGSSSLIRPLSLTEIKRLERSRRKKHFKNLIKKKFAEEDSESFEENTSIDFSLEALRNRRKAVYPTKLEARTPKQLEAIEKGFKDEWRNDLREDEASPSFNDINEYIKKFAHAKGKTKKAKLREKPKREQTLDLASAKILWQKQRLLEDSNWNYLAKDLREKRHNFENYKTLPLKSPSLSSKHELDPGIYRYLEPNKASGLIKLLRFREQGDSLYAITKRENKKNEERLLKKLGSLTNFESDGSGGSVKRNTPFQGHNFNIELNAYLNGNNENDNFELDSLEDNENFVKENRETVTKQAAEKKKLGIYRKIIKKVIDKQREYQDRVGHMTDDTDLTYQPLDFIKNRLNLKLEDEYYNRQMRYITDRFSPNSRSKFNEFTGELNDLRPDPIPFSEDWSIKSQSVNTRKSENWVNHRIEKNFSRLQHGVKNVRNLLNTRKRLLIQSHQNSILLPGLRSYRLKLILEKNFFKLNKVSKFEELKTTNLTLRLRGSKILSFASIGNVSFEQNLIRLLTDEMEGDIINTNSQKELKDNPNNTEQSNQSNWISSVSNFIAIPLHRLKPLIEMAMIKKFHKLINDESVWSSQALMREYLANRTAVQFDDYTGDYVEALPLFEKIRREKILPNDSIELIKKFLAKENRNKRPYLFINPKLPSPKKGVVLTNPFHRSYKEPPSIKDILISNRELNEYNRSRRFSLSKKANYQRDVFLKNYIEFAKEKNFQDLIIKNKVPKNTPPKNESKSALKPPLKLTTNNPNLIKGMIDSPVTLPPHPKIDILGEIPLDEKKLADILANTGARAREVFHHPTSRSLISARFTTYNEAQKYQEAKKNAAERIRKKEAKMIDNALNKIPFSDENLDKEEEVRQVPLSNEANKGNNTSDHRNNKTDTPRFVLEYNSTQKLVKEILAEQDKKDGLNKWLPSEELIRENNGFIVDPHEFEESTDSSDSEQSSYSSEISDDNFINEIAYREYGILAGEINLGNKRYSISGQGIGSDFLTRNGMDSITDIIDNANKKDWEEVFKNKFTDISSQPEYGSLSNLSDNVSEDTDDLILNNELHNAFENYSDTSLGSDFSFNGNPDHSSSSDSSSLNSSPDTTSSDSSIESSSNSSSSDHSTDSSLDWLGYSSSSSLEDDLNPNLEYDTDFESGYESGSEFSDDTNYEPAQIYEYGHVPEPNANDLEYASATSAEDSENNSEEFFDAAEEFPLPSLPWYSGSETESGSSSEGDRREHLYPDELPFFQSPENPDIIKLYNKLYSEAKSSKKLHNALLIFLFEQLFTEVGSSSSPESVLTESNKQVFEMFHNGYLNASNANKRYQPQFLHPSYGDRLKIATFASKAQPKTNVIPFELDEQESALLSLLRSNIPFLSLIAPKKTVINKNYLNNKNLNFFASDISSDILGYGKNLTYGSVFDSVNLYPPTLKRKQEKLLSNLYIQHEQVQSYITLFNSIEQIFDKNQNMSLNTNFDHRVALKLQSYYSHELHQDIIKIANSLTNATRKSKRQSQLLNQFIIDELSLLKLRELFHIFSKIGHQKMQLTSKHLRKFKKKEAQSLWTDDAISEIIQDNLIRQTENLFIGKIILKSIVKYYRKVYQDPLRRGFTHREIAKSIRKGGTMHVFPLKFKDLVMKYREYDRRPIGPNAWRSGVPGLAYVPIDLPEEVEDKYGDFLIDFLEEVPFDTELRYVDKDIQNIEIDPHLYYRDFSRYEYQMQDFRSKHKLYNSLIKHIFEKDMLKVKPKIDKQISRELFKLITGKPWYVGKYARNITKKYKEVDRFARLNNFAVITPDVVSLHTATKKLKRGNTDLFIKLLNKYNISTRSNLTRKKRPQYNIKPLQYLNPWLIVNIRRKKYVDQFNLLVKAIQTSGWRENQKGFILGNLSFLNKIQLVKPENKFNYKGKENKQIKNNKRNINRGNVLKFSQILTRSDHTNWPYWVLNKIVNSQREAFLHTQAFESNSLRRNEDFSDIIFDETNYPPLTTDKNKFKNYLWPAFKNMNLYAGPAQDFNWNSYFDFINESPDWKKYEMPDLLELETLISDYANCDQNIELGKDDSSILQQFESEFNDQNGLKHFINDPEQRDFARSFKLKGENFPRTFTELHIAKENHFDDLLAADILPYRVYLRLFLENPNSFKIKATPTYGVSFGSSPTKIFYSLHSPRLFSRPKVAKKRLTGQFPGIWASPQLRSWELIERDTPRPDYTGIDDEDMEAEFFDVIDSSRRDCQLTLFDNSIDEYFAQNYQEPESKIKREKAGREPTKLTHVDLGVEKKRKVLLADFEKADEYDEAEEVMFWLNDYYTYESDFKGLRRIDFVGKPKRNDPRSNFEKNQKFGIGKDQPNRLGTTKKRTLNIFRKIKEIRAKLREEAIAEAQLSEEERFDLEQNRRQILLRHIRGQGKTLSRSEENNQVNQALTRIKGYQTKLLETVPKKKKLRSMSSRVLNKRLTKSLKRTLAKFYTIFPEESVVSAALKEFEKRNFKGKKLFKTPSSDESANKAESALLKMKDKMFRLREIAIRNVEKYSEDEMRNLYDFVGPNILDKFCQLPNPQNVVSFKNDYILSPIPGIEADYSDFKAETSENINFRKKVRMANEFFYKSNHRDLVKTYLTDSSKSRNAKFLSMERPRFSKSVQIIWPGNSLLQFTILYLYASYYVYILYACIEFILKRPLFEKIKGSIRDNRRLGFIADSISPTNFKQVELYLNTWAQKRRSLLMYRFTRTPETLLIKKKYKDSYICPENTGTIQSIFNKNEILLKFSYNPLKWLTSSFASEHFAVLALGSPEYGQIWARSLFLHENISCFSFELYSSLFYNYQKVVYMSNNTESNFTIIPSQLYRHQESQRPSKIFSPLMSLRFGLSNLFESKDKKVKLGIERELLGRYKNQYKLDILYSQNILKRCVNFARENSPCFMVLNGLDRAILAHKSGEDGEFWVGGIFGEFGRLPLSTTYPFTQMFQDEIIDSIGNLLERIKSNSLYKVCLIIPDSSRVDYRLLLKKRFYFQYILEDTNDLNKNDRENFYQKQPDFLGGQAIENYPLLDSINPTIMNLNIPTTETTAKFIESHKVISSQNSDMALIESIDVREYLNRYIFPIMYMYVASSSSKKIFPRLATYMARNLIYTHFFREWRVIHQKQNHSEISWEKNYIINEFLIPVLFLNLDNISLCRYFESEDKQTMFTYFYLNICLYNHIIFMLNEPNI